MIDGAELAGPVLAWYDGAARELPWRRPGVSAWAVLVSEVMLQQTPVNRVLPMYEAWLARWPTPAALAVAPAGEAIRQWDRLGYPRRALRLHHAATTIVRWHGGELPDDLDALVALPGVGDYTARAVASFAFGQRHAVVDVNVRRVLARVIAGDASPVGGAAADRRTLEALLPTDPTRAARFGVALMEVGALLCRPRAPLCGDCPLATRCEWRRAGYPTDGRTTRRQAYEGTDRQARGRQLARLRATAAPVPLVELLGIGRDRDQAQRALAGLLDDGLVEQAGEVVMLP